VSPWTDLANLGESYQTRRWDPSSKEGDPVFRSTTPAEDSQSSADHVLGMPHEPGTFDATEPLISVLHADLGGFPPTRIDVGDAEVMLNDSLDFGHKAAAAESPVSVYVWEKMFHVWVQYSEGCGTGTKLKQAADCVNQQAKFLKRLASVKCHKPRRVTAQSYHSRLSEVMDWVRIATEHNVRERQNCSQIHH
jgi:monoterpene epsilon-lactone hydrolase